MPMVDIDWLKDHVEVPEGLTYEQLAKYFFFFVMD